MVKKSRYRYSNSILPKRVDRLIDKGLGWEDQFVILLAEGLVTKQDEMSFRRYVLNAMHERIKKDPNYYHRADGGFVL